MIDTLFLFCLLSVTMMLTPLLALFGVAWTTGSCLGATIPRSTDEAELLGGVEERVVLQKTENRFEGQNQGGWVRVVDLASSRKERQFEQATVSDPQLPTPVPFVKKVALLTLKPIEQILAKAPWGCKVFFIKWFRPDCW
jgi:hypothetical protein